VILLSQSKQKGEIMNLRIIKNLILPIFFVTPLLVYGQSGSSLSASYKVLNPFDKNVPSPEASSLITNTMNHVDYYTGSVSYNIPLYEIVSHGFRMPIQLAYKNNGIKVNQVSSNVGLGWSLIAGGVITREVRGLRDEINFNGYTSFSGWRTYGYFINNSFKPDNSNHVNHLIDLVEGLMDGEPDLYYYRFGSFSGNFIFDPYNNIHFIPAQNFNVEVQRSGNTVFGQSNHIISFTITTDDGTKYIFGSHTNHRDKVVHDYLGNYSNRESVYNNINNPLARKYMTWNVTPIYNQEYYTSWYLSEIVLPSIDESIIFEYESDEVYTYVGTTEKYMAGPGGPDGDPSLHSFDPNDPLILFRTNRFRLSNNSRISGIYWNGGRVDFIKSEFPRQDIHDLADSKGYAISKIEVYNTSDHLIKEVDLEQSYFNNTGVGTEYNEYTSYFKRLRLDAVTINDQIYNFYYIHDDSNPQLKFPSRNTVEMDFWGYYKKLPGTEFGEPTQPYGNRAAKSKIYVYPDDYDNELYRSVYSIWPRSNYHGVEIIINGNDRTPELQYAKIGMLRKIELRTGGLIEYEYELNDFFFDGASRNGGGIRVKEVKVSDGVNQSTDRIIAYEYIDEYGVTSGRITIVPDFAMQNIHARIPEVNWYNHLAITNDPSLKQAVGAIRFNDSKTGLGGTHGGYVGYNNVKRIENNGSYTEYEFDIPVSAETINFFEISENNYLYSKTHRLRYVDADNLDLLFHFPNNYIGYSQPLWIDNAPFFAMPKIDWCQGNLLKEKYFEETGTLLKEIEYQYEVVPSQSFVYYCQSSIYNIFQASFLVLGSGTPVFGPFDLYQWDIVWGLNKYASGRKNLILRTEKEYLQDGTLTRQEEYEYNSQGYMKNRTVILNTEEEQLDEYIYISDFHHNPLVEQCNNQYQQCIHDAGDLYEQCENVCEQYYSNFPELLQSCIELCLQEHLSNLVYCDYTLQTCLAGISHHFTSMFNKNMISLPVEIRTSIERDTEPLKQTSGKVYNYNTSDPEDNSFLKLVEVLILETDEPLANSDYVTLDEFGDLVIPSTYNSEVEYTKYDLKGNINEVKLRNDQTTTYLWGYHYNLPIAKIENASYDQVVSGIYYFGYTIENLQDKTDDQLRSIFAMLRNHPVLKNSTLISSYTHKPLVGMTSETDPSGRTTYYEYDPFGRLQYIKNHEGHYVQKFDYHYREDD